MAPGARRRQSSDHTIVTAGGGAGPAGVGDVIGCKQIQPGARAGGIGARGGVPARRPPRAGALARAAWSRVRVGRGARQCGASPRGFPRASARAGRGARHRPAAGAAREPARERPRAVSGERGATSAAGAAGAAVRRHRPAARRPRQGSGVGAPAAAIVCARRRRRRRVCASLPFPGAQGRAGATTQCPAVREPSAGSLPHVCEPWPSDRGLRPGASAQSEAFAGQPAAPGPCAGARRSHRTGRQPGPGSGSLRTSQSSVWPCAPPSALRLPRRTVPGIPSQNPWGE